MSQFTKTEKSGLIRTYESARLKAQDLRTSRALLIAGGGVALALLAWVGLSALGVLPDEARLLNRRFVSTASEDDLAHSIGLVALGAVSPDGRLDLKEFFTAAALSTDGFMLTSKGVASATGLFGPWVFVGGRRYDAKVIAVESLSDFAIIKVDGDLPLKFRLWEADRLDRLNLEVLAIGRQALEDKIDSPTEWPLSLTRGTISRTYADKLSTEWIEHSAALGSAGGRGSPLLLGDYIVGLNVDSEAGISRAVSVLPHRERIYKAIQDWKKSNEKG